MLVKLFTHNDMDGVGCSILAKYVFGEANVDVEYCNYNEINIITESFFSCSGKWNYDLVLITDISINQDVVNIIEQYKSCDNFPVVQLIDHHQSAEWLNKYDWAKVEIEEHGEKTCGTRLLYDYLNEKVDFNIEFDFILNFVEQVKRYDTWLWKEKYNDEFPKHMNDLFHILGREWFIDRILECLLNKKRLKFTTIENSILETNQEKINKYILNKNKELYIKKINGCTIGLIFSENYVSELGNKLSELHNDLDLIAIINFSDKSVSYRTVKNDINLGEFAKKLGGGGHAKSAGSPIINSVCENIINQLFSD